MKKTFSTPYNYNYLVQSRPAVQGIVTVFYSMFGSSTLPVLAELVERWRRIAGHVGVLHRLWQRRPGEQLLVLGQTAAEGLTGSDGLQRNCERQEGC